VSGTLNRVVGQGTSANPIELKTESDYYPLLVDKSWGGTNVAPVIGQYFLAQKDFKIGDILMIYTTKTETGTNAYWQALYQGDGKFLVEVYGSATVMYYDQVKNIVNGGTFTKADGTSTATIMAAKSYAVIRFSNILGGKPAKVPETITDTVEREESPVAVTGRELTEAEQAVIKALTAEQLGDKNYNLKNFAPWVYKAINMDSYVTTFLNGDSNANALNALFNAKSPHVLNEASKYNYVLVPNSYGGTSIKNSVGNFVLPVAEYKIGDILITRASYTKPAADDPTASSSTYWSAVYQGDGKFLVETYAGAPIVMTYDELMAIGLNGGTYGDKLLTPWGMYAVLRFSYILPEPTTPPDGPGGEGGETPEDPEDPENPENPEEPETPTAPGRALTEAEKAAIAAINKDSFAVSADWGVLSTGIFATIGVEYTSELDIWSVFTTLFTQDVSNDSSEGVKDVGAPLDRAAVAEEYRTTWDMIVANSWGGSWFNKNYRNTLTADDFQIGDILVARSSTSPYWMFLYIGNDQFVAWCGSGKSYRGTTTMDLLLNSFLAGDGFKYTPGTNVDAETGLDKVIATGAVRHYCIMRVGQILEPLEETPATVGRELTEEEKEILSAVTADTKYTGNWESVVAVFNKIGFDCPNTATTSDIMSLFDGEAKAKTTLKERDTVAEELLYTYDMIVENGWGGAWFAKDNRNTLTPDSFQIGDILYIRTSDIAYWFLFYTGDNTFVAWNSTNRTNTGTVSMDAVLDLWLQNKAFTYDLEGVETTKTPGTVRQYCILRVSQILEPLDEASVPRDVMEKKLTAEEKAAIAAIQSTDDFGGQGTMAFINWVYAQANIDASSFNTRNGRAYYDNLFAGRKPNTEESLYPVYVDQSYGGTYPVGTTNGGYRLDEFIIGDIFFGRYTNEADTNIYLTAFYQGNGNFLVCEGYESSSGITSTSSSAATVMNFDDPTTTDVVETIYDYQIWYFYYTLNFDQVAGTANN